LKPNKPTQERCRKCEMEIFNNCGVWETVVYGSRVCIGSMDIGHIPERPQPTVGEQTESPVEWALEQQVESLMARVEKLHGALQNANKTCERRGKRIAELEAKLSPTPIPVGEPRTEIIRIVRAQLVDEQTCVENLWTSHPDVLFAGCKAVGYADPEISAERFAGFVADAVLAYLNKKTEVPNVKN
jgi:hypothetical protein